MALSVRQGLIIGGIIFVSVLGFQNCSDFALQDQILYEQGLLESRDNLDRTVLPKLLESSSLKRWYKTGNSNFVTSNTMLGDQWSIVVAVDKTVTGRFITVHSGAGTEEGYLEVTAGKIRAARVGTDKVGAPYATYKEVLLPSSGDKMLVAVTFGVAAKDVSLMINGVVQTAAMVTSGSPSEFSYLAKAIVVNDPMVKIGEYVVFIGDSLDSTGGLSNGELNSMSRYIANNNLIPNVIYDPSLATETGGGSDAVVNPKFVLAKEVIDRQCASCHNGSQSPKLNNLSEASARSLVTPKNKAGSYLYYWIQGSGGSPGTMPKGGSMPAADLQKIGDWIDSL